MKKSSGDARSKSEKVYTQQDVDILLEQKVESLSFGKNETQVLNSPKKSDKTIIANLVQKSNRILVSITSHALPFDFFPNILNVEEDRITIIDRHFLSSEVHSIDIKNISNILINTTFFFSQLVFISKTFEENEIKMSSLRTSEAIFARRMIEGLRMFKEKQIDTSSYTKEELISKLKELSTTKIVL